MALIAGRPGLAAAALALAVIAVFLMHEPVLVLAGHRGRRVQRDEGARAGRRLAGCAAVAVVLGGAGLAAGGAALVGPLAMVAGLAGITAVMVALHRERTLSGETWAASTLAAAAVPVAVAAGSAPEVAVRAWLCWTLGFTAVTGAVRATIAAAKHRRRVAPLAATALATGAAVALAIVVDAGLAACSPLVAAALALVALPASPRHLRRIGWMLVAASVATGAWLIALGA